MSGGPFRDDQRVGRRPTARPLPCVMKMGWTDDDGGRRAAGRRVARNAVATARRARRAVPRWTGPYHRPPQPQCEELRHDLRPECQSRSRPDHRQTRDGRPGCRHRRWRRHRPRPPAGVHAARRQPQRPRPIARAGGGDRPGQLAARHRLQDRRGRQRARRLPRPWLRQQRPGVLDGRVPGVRRDVSAGQHDPVLGRGPERLRHGQRFDRAVLLPARRAGLPRRRLLQGAARPIRRDRRVARPGLRHRPRIRAPRPGPAGRSCSRPATPAAPRATRSGRSSRPTASRASGRTMPRAPSSSSRSRLPRSRMRSMPPARSATTGSRRRRAARSTRTRGRTARRPSARSGSARATTRATRRPATRSTAHLIGGRSSGHEPQT